MFIKLVMEVNLCKPILVFKKCDEPGKQLKILIKKITLKI